MRTYVWPLSFFLSHLKKGNVNVISVDWGPRTLGMSNMNYWNAVETVPLVGVHLANLVQFLINHTGVTGLITVTQFY